jgi:antitoxin component YwqK of YwqJK toxin-antitoxin module
MRYPYLLIAIAGLLPALPAQAKLVEEKFDDGKIHLRYNTDAKDRKNGDYLENFPGGKVHIRGSYTSDKKSGTWTTYSEDGKVTEIASYRNDQLDGPYQYNFLNGSPELKTVYHGGQIAGVINTFAENGKPVFSLSYPIAWDAVQKAYHTWSPAERNGPKMLEEPHSEKPYKPGKMADESQQAALKYLMLYRFLSGVTVANMGIDADYAVKAQYGAVILAKIGHLSHTPDRPDDMDEAFFKTAYAGTSSSDLAQGPEDLFGSIDLWMDDSDESNIAKVGHRQWILMPSVQKIAFGYADRFSSLYVFDGTKRSVMNWSFISYPGPGFYPHSMLRKDAAWSISLNSQRCKVGDPNSVQITISTLDEHFAVTDTATADIVGIPQSPTSDWPCIIFKPNIKFFGVGRYVVQVAGIKTSTGAPAPLSYLVDVVDMPADQPKP